MNRKRNADHLQQTHNGHRSSDTVISPVVITCAVGLMVCRFSVPAESAPEGATLWIVQLWFVTIVLWGWQCYRLGNYRVCWGYADLALWALVAGQVISALAVVMTEGGGHKRAAVNMLWEWVGLGVLFFVLRQCIRSNSDRRHLVTSMAAVGAVLAGFGLWQHYVWLPEQSRSYHIRFDSSVTELREIEEKLKADLQSVTPAMKQQRDEILRRLNKEGIPTDPRTLGLWLDRLSGSSEPFGMFALANTFASVLLVCLFMMLGIIVRSWKNKRLWCVWIPISALTFYCLVLTKSRTAWVGCVAGLGIWAIQSLRCWYLNHKSNDPSSEGREKLEPRRVLIWAIPSILIVIALVTAAGLSGSLDRQVLSEASKSLKYRFGYWAATWDVIREQPILGTGPGNFRQHYLAFKRPESSEEIADPHNLFLDVWSNAGILAVVGLLALIGFGLKSLVKRDRSIEATEPVSPGEGDGGLLDPCSFGVVLGFVMIILVNYVFEFVAEFRLVIMITSVIVIVFASKKLGQASSESLPSQLPNRIANAATGGALVALIIHLLGAGGIAMPAVTQLLLLLILLVPMGETSPTHKSSAKGSNADLGSPHVVAGIGLVAAACFMICFLSATLPVIKRNFQLAAGDGALIYEQNAARAHRFYRDATVADALSPDPWTRRAELTFQQWDNSVSPKQSQFETALKFAEEAIQRDPHSSKRYFHLGEWYVVRYNKTRDPKDAILAADWMIKAIQLYPQNAVMRAELASAQATAGRLPAARPHARAAVQLDHINRKAGHIDKFLTDKQLQAMHNILHDRG